MNTNAPIIARPEGLFLSSVIMAIQTVEIRTKRTRSTRLRARLWISLKIRNRKKPASVKKTGTRTS